MNVSRFTAVLIAVVMAIAISCLQHGRDGLAYARFNLGIGRSDEREAIQETIRQYNATTSGLYATGGYLDEFRIMPADNLLKRKHYQNIEPLVRNNVVIVFDQDQFVSRGVRFYGRDRACVISSELWAMVFQNLQTRQKLSKVKGEALTVRYMLRRQKGKWLVAEVEVFQPTEPVKAPDTSQM